MYRKNEHLQPRRVSFLGGSFIWRFTVVYMAIIIRILAGDHWEPVFLVSGDDLKVHLYRGGLPTEAGQVMVQT